MNNELFSYIRRYRFINDAKGAMAIEFALIIPVMLLVYMLMIDGWHAINDRRKVNHIAQMTAEVAATFTAFDDNARSSLKQNLNAQLLLFPDRKVTVEITSVAKEGGVYKIYFQKYNVMSNIQSSSITALPVGKLDWVSDMTDVTYIDGDNIIIVEAEIETTSYLTKLFQGGTSKVTASAQTQPYNSRSFVFYRGVVDANRFNWQ